MREGGRGEQLVSKGRGRGPEGRREAGEEGGQSKGGWKEKRARGREGKGESEDEGEAEGEAEGEGDGGRKREENTSKAMKKQERREKNGESERV